MSKNKYLLPLIVMFVLFFLFGFIPTMNNSTINFLMNAFGLNDVEKQLRVQLSNTVANTIKNAFSLLGIQVPERM